MAGALIRRKWTCSACERSFGIARVFSTSTCRAIIGPESPRYIDIPEPPQQDSNYVPRLKGVLPAPRNVFHPTVGGDAKASKEWIDRATPLPKETPVSLRPDLRVEWKRRMSAKRRQNLREGLGSLQRRKQYSRKIRAQRTAERGIYLKSKRDAPQREDERLTQPTTAVLMKRIIKTRIIDPNREERLVRMAANVQAKESQRALERQFALHTLYMHARDFIVNEEQLDAAVERAFGTVEDPVTFAGATATYKSSVWATTPEGIQNKLNKIIGGSDRSKNDWQAEEQQTRVTEKRLGDIAGELTGGKL